MLRPKLSLAGQIDPGLFLPNFGKIFLKFFSNLKIFHRGTLETFQWIQFYLHFLFKFKFYDKKFLKKFKNQWKLILSGSNLAGQIHWPRPDFGCNI